MASDGDRYSMTDEHKQALARGRSEGRIVREYLRALPRSDEAQQQGRAESLAFELQRIESRLAVGVDPLERVELIQRRNDLERERDSPGESPQAESLEADFVSVIGSYAARKGLSYWALREVGVPDAVLARAGIVPDGEHPAVKLMSMRGAGGETDPHGGPARAASRTEPSPQRVAAESLTSFLAELLSERDRDP